jgi:hypothetical protein
MQAAAEPIWIQIDTTAAIPSDPLVSLGTLQIPA